MTPRSANVLRRGVDASPPEVVPLRAGPLTVQFEGGNLRSIRLGDREVLRRVYVAVRDHNWGTVPATLSDLSLRSEPNSFEISYRAEHQAGPIDFAWNGHIRGESSGAVTFTMSGEARSTFLRNRIGFCVLHPIRECAGQPCVVETVDGQLHEGAFPRSISPHQPFQDLCAITHEVIPGLRAEVRFEGETFEMEDQRNWTDASFKTYGTPLHLPFPVEIAQGTRIEQSVTLQLIGPAPAVVVAEEEQQEDATATVTITRTPIGSLPAIGLGVGDLGMPWSPADAAKLYTLNLAHLRHDLDLTHPDWPALFREAYRRTERLRVPLEIALLLAEGCEAELEKLRRIIEGGRSAVARWLVFSRTEKATTGRWVRLAREHLAAATPGVPFGAGTDAYFAELNRGGPPGPPAEFVCYSINPQVHADDDASLIETLEAQPETVASARALGGGLPVVVSPITLKPRFNPNASGPEPEPAPGELPAQVDPRQMSMLVAAWTLGSIAALADAVSLTYYATTGWRGVMMPEDAAMPPDRFPAPAGFVFPMSQVFAFCGANARRERLAIQSSDPAGVAALACQVGERGVDVLLANLGPDPRRVRLEGLGVSGFTWTLDENSATGSILPLSRFDTDRGALTVELLPYALARFATNELGEIRGDAV